MPNLSNNAPSIVHRLAKSTWVVLMRVDGKLTVALDPALNRVWSGQGIFGKRLGEEIVKECEAEGIRAEVRTWGEAVALITKESGGEKEIEKQLYERLVAKKQAAATSVKKLPPQT